MTRKFKIGVSFTGKYRDIVEKICEALINNHNYQQEEIFYDEWHTAEIARISADEILQNIYKNQCECIVVFLSDDYKAKHWTNNIEWESIKKLITTCDKKRILLFKMDSLDINTIDGLNSERDIFINIDNYKRTDGTMAIDRIARFIVKTYENIVKEHNVSSSSEIDTNLIEYQQKFEHMKYFDRLALEVIEKKDSQNKLIDAIFVQYNNKKSTFSLQNSANSILDLMYNHIINSIELDNKYPLSIEGEPGTGKSTILSLLYYKFHKEYEHNNNKTRPFLIDTHYYDKWKDSRISAVDDLNRQLSEIKNQISQKSHTKFIIFIDGINKYKRGDGKLQQQINQFIRQIDNNNIWFVASIGQDSDYSSLSKYPLCGCFNDKIVLSPVKNICEYFSQLIRQTLIYYNSVNNNKDIDGDIIHKFCDYITGLGGRETYFRTVRFIIEQYYHFIEQQYSKDFFKEDVGIIFNNYFTKVEHHNQKTILDIGKFIANKLFSTKQIKNTPKEIYYLYKSEPIKYYFLACYYISIITNKSSKELKQIDCIFTHRINTFIIDLMNVDENTEKEVVQGIQELMHKKETTFKQKNQFVLLLGRIKQNDLKEISKRILNNEYSQNINNEDEKNDIRMYVRNIGMSLISLGVTEHENSFYNQFINNRFSSRINRNFYIQYFLKHKYYFEPNIDNDKNCTVDEINELYTKIYKSMFEKKEAKKEYFNINIIILLNLTIYKLFHLKKISEDEIKNAQELIKEILCLTSHTAINTNVLQYVKNIEIFINKIFNEKVFDLSIVKTIANIL